MIEPTKKDIGRVVAYCPVRDKVQYGVITSFNERTVFVQYKKGCTSQATPRENLRWSFLMDKRTLD